MLYSGVKKESLEIHERSVNKYNALLQFMNERCESLYKTRQEYIVINKNIEIIIKTNNNSPKEIEA